MSAHRTTLIGRDHAEAWFSLHRAREVRWGWVAAYVAISYGLAWLLLLPVWLTTRTMGDPKAFPLTAMMMFTPTVAALIVGKWFGKEADWLRSVGLKQSRGTGRTVRYTGAAFGLVMAVIASATAISHIAGWLKLDIGLSLLRKQIQDAGQPAQPWALLAIMLVVMAVAGVAATIPLTLGEEIGWRGFLTPALMPLGRVPALLLCGIIWALWHSPLVFIGFNYPGYPRVAAMAMMVVFCIAVGTLLSWTRSRSTSVIPAGVGHATINALANEPGKWTAVDTPLPPDMGLIPPMGASALVLYLALAGLLLALRWTPSPHRSPHREPEVEPSSAGNAG